MGRFVILSGPSCVGKGPLIASFRKFFPELAENWKNIVLINSRGPRPGETDGVDYYFRSRSDLEEMSNNTNFLVFPVRGDLQAVDLAEMSEIVQKEDLFFEGNPFVGKALLEIAASRSMSVLSIFLSPLSRDEIRFLQGKGVDLNNFIARVMRRKLLRRTSKYQGLLSLLDLEDIEKRCLSAFLELKYAPLFQYVIPNHDGEDSENWDAFYYPIGDAARALFSFKNLLAGVADEYSEKWEDDLFQ